MSIPDLNPPREATSSSSSSLRIAAGGPAVAAPAGCDVEDSDEDLFTVPDVESADQSEQKAGGGGPAASTSGARQNVAGGDGRGTPRKARNPADREYRRLKRLLRNRVSAQQARERKKMYVSELESRTKDLELRNSSLQERISTLINENNMLRKVLMNTRPKVDEEGGNPKNDQPGSKLIK